MIYNLYTFRKFDGTGRENNRELIPGKWYANRGKSGDHKSDVEGDMAALKMRKGTRKEIHCKLMAILVIGHGKKIRKNL